MAALSRAEILARKVTGRTERVDLPGDDGAYVVVRGLTRGESHETVGATTREAEVIALAHGLVEPTMTRADVEEWLDGDMAGSIQAVVMMIQELSGSGDGQGKEYTKSVSGE